jgi:hypothetical protein
MIAALIQVITGIDETRALSRGVIPRHRRSSDRHGRVPPSEELDEHRDYEAFGERKASE